MVWFWFRIWTSVGLWFITGTRLRFFIAVWFRFFARSFFTLTFLTTWAWVFTEKNYTYMVSDYVISYSYIYYLPSLFWLSLVGFRSLVPAFPSTGRRGWRWPYHARLQLLFLHDLCPWWAVEVLSLPTTLISVVSILQTLLTAVRTGIQFPAY